MGLGLSHPVYIISINVAVSNRMRKGIKCHKEVTGKQAGEEKMSCHNRNYFEAEVE